MVIVVCSSCSVRGIPNVIDHLSMGIVELFLICLCDFCYKGVPLCSPGSCECGPVDGFVAVNQLAVCVFM